MTHNIGIPSVPQPPSTNWEIQSSANTHDLIDAKCGCGRKLPTTLAFLDAPCWHCQREYMLTPNILKPEWIN